jgi:hypothetical protein
VTPPRFRRSVGAAPLTLPGRTPSPPPRKPAIGAQRREFIRLRHDRAIGDDVLHRIERELDLQEAVLE